MEWCRQYKNRGDEFWDNIFWTDESRISLFTSGKPPLVRRAKSEALKEKNLIPTTKFPVSVMIWCGFGVNGVGPLKIIDGNMDSNKYIETLEHYYMPFLRENTENNPTRRQCSLWVPYYYPDLNPIENLFAYLKRRVAP